MRNLLFISLILVASNCNSQDNITQKAVGGPCEGCEAIYEFGSRHLSNRDTLPDYEKGGMKMLLTGTVFKADGNTPAPNVILYIYHTDQEGIYPNRQGAAGWEKRHGYLRGWIKTGNDGKFYFLTNRPAPYPGRAEPAHIHITVKEPGFKEYYLDSYHFTDDPLLTAKIKDQLPGYGGSGLVTPVQKNDVFIAKRDIYLGRNIIDYPK